MSLTTVRTINVDLETYLAQVGTIFRAFRAQDSGCVAYGVAAEGRQWFVKHSRVARGIASLRRAAHINSVAQHPALPHLHNVITTPDGLALVYDWVPGLVLRDVTPLSAAERRASTPAERRTHPDSTLARFLALPTAQILAALDTIYEAHLLLADLGFIAVDFYDGCILYDFAAQRVYLGDLDEYRPGPFVLEEERLPGSSRYMAPEEFRRGATMDQVTNVFALGRAACELLGDGTHAPEGWRGTEALRLVAVRATAPRREERYPSVCAFVQAWQLAAYQAAHPVAESAPPPVAAETQRAWEEEERATFRGWDFSRLAGRMVEEEPPWPYEELVQEAMQQSRAVLDLGTGGGERLASWHANWPARVVATEGYPPNARLARQLLHPLGGAVVQSQDGLVMPLPFADATFDLVICRHIGFNLREVERVLTPGGLFITQQVDGHNLRDLVAAFDASPCWPYSTLALWLAIARSTQMVVERAESWQGKATIAEVGALVYFLKAIPWLVEGFSVARHHAHLARLHAQVERGEPLTFQQARWLMVARKPG
jgi:serine/threonine-protein kinase